MNKQNEKIWIPWAQPVYWGKEKQYVADAIETAWISGGPYVNKFEDELKGYLETQHALAVNNGTSAIHLAYLGLDLKAGDEVIVPGFAFMAAANIAELCNIRPVFVDVDPETWCIDPKKIEKKISPKTKAIVAIHTYGNLCDMDAINQIAQGHSLYVIEDSAESFGSKYNGKQSGTLCDIGTFSFHATKTITTGEGGMVCTSNSKFAERMQLYRSHGMLRKRYYWHDAHGHNFRLTNLQAALGCAQFEAIEKITRGRKQVYSLYCEHFCNQKDFKVQKITDHVDPLIWAFAIELSPAAFPQGRDQVLNEMKEQGIETRPGFVAPTEMTIYEESAAVDIPVSENLSKSVMSLPTYPGLTEQDINRISNALFNLRR